ncbi:hypothetical protein QJS66_06250 [Kocuria rhizophila]|nr:hypothetical protein QJS66_06250 [Kocuria rhizophila]
MKCTYHFQDAGVPSCSRGGHGRGQPEGGRGQIHGLNVLPISAQGTVVAAGRADPDHEVVERADSDTAVPPAPPAPLGRPKGWRSDPPHNLRPTREVAG